MPLSNTLNMFVHNLSANFIWYQDFSISLTISNQDLNWGEPGFFKRVPLVGCRIQYNNTIQYNFMLLRWPHTTKAGFRVGRRSTHYNNGTYIYIKEACSQNVIIWEFSNLIENCYTRNTSDTKTISSRAKLLVITRRYLSKWGGWLATRHTPFLPPTTF